MVYVFEGFMYQAVISIAAVLFFSRCVSVSRKYCWGIVYVFASFGLYFLDEKYLFPNIVSAMASIVLLALYGVLFLKCKWVHALTVSSLAFAVILLINGTIQSIIHILLFYFKFNSDFMIHFILIITSLTAASLICVSYLLLLKTFYQSVENAYNFAMFLLMIPVFYISLAEKVMIHSAYGHIMVKNNKNGLILPQANDIEMLILHIFACVGVICALIAYQRMIHNMQAEQTVRLLEQQTIEQEVYVKEAQLRYEKTRAFRHDIRNHFIVLQELLKTGKSQEAYAYIANLGQIADTLSFPCKTGNPIVDALLGSKLAIAQQENIKTAYDIKIPKLSCVKDIDWCIVLSNAIDNAINASVILPKESRSIQISGKKKGNFYLLHLENRYDNTKKIPTDGTGLTNIKTVIHKYKGAVEIETSADVFKLNMLFDISRQF